MFQKTLSRGHWHVFNNLRTLQNTLQPERTLWKLRLQRFHVRMLYQGITKNNLNSLKFKTKTNTVTKIHCGYYRTTACKLTNTGNDDDLHLDLSDPEIKRLLKEISSDFENEPNIEVAKHPADTSSSSSSDSDTSDDSGSSSFSSDDECSTTDTNFEQLSEPNKSNDIETKLSSDLDGADVEDFGDDVQYEWIKEEKAAPISLKRGNTGVFDIDELVTLLRSENGRDICVIGVPEDFRYVDYLVIVTATSVRHMKSVAEYVKLLHKKKKKRKDNFVKIEGTDSKTWMAMDLGNIALHIFMPETREFYDLETLWTCGPEFDDKSLVEIDPYLPFPEADFSILQHKTEYFIPKQVEEPEQTSFESLVYHAPSQEDALRPPKPEE